VEAGGKEGGLVRNVVRGDCKIGLADSRVLRRTCPIVFQKKERAQLDGAGKRSDALGGKFIGRGCFWRQRRIERDSPIIKGSVCRRRT